jgi:hypothetical protein
MKYELSPMVGAITSPQIYQSPSVGTLNSYLTQSPLTPEKSALPIKAPPEALLILNSVVPTGRLGALGSLAS